MNFAEAEICSNVDILFKPACVEVYYLVAGNEDTRQLNTSRLDVYFSHTPSGTSYLNVSGTSKPYRELLSPHGRVASVLADKAFSRQPKNEKFNRQFK